jgi:hypothetical protein
MVTPAGFACNNDVAQWLWEVLMHRYVLLSIQDTMRTIARRAPFIAGSIEREKCEPNKRIIEHSAHEIAIQPGKHCLVFGNSVMVLTVASKIPNRFAAASRHTQ